MAKRTQDAGVMERTARTTVMMLYSLIVVRFTALLSYRIPLPTLVEQHACESDVTGDRIDDIKLIVHDRVIVYPGQ